MTVSKTRKENYLGYLLFELVMVFALTFVATGVIVFYLTGKSDLRKYDHKITGNKLETLTDNPLLFAAICLVPALIALSFVVYYRNRNYIVGYQFDAERSELSLLVRNLTSKGLQTILIPYASVAVRKFTERKILFNARYQGIRITFSGKHYDFVTNNFIWETQPRERIAFVQQTDSISR